MPPFSKYLPFLGEVTSEFSEMHYNWNPENDNKQIDAKVIGR